MLRGRRAYLVVVMDAVECIIVRVSGSPTDAATLFRGIALTLPASVLTDAVNHTPYIKFARSFNKNIFVPSPRSVL